MEFQLPAIPAYNKQVLFSKMKEAILQYSATLSANSQLAQIRVPLDKPLDTFPAFATKVVESATINYVDADTQKQFRMNVNINTNLAPIGDVTGAVNCMYCISVEIIAPYNGVVFQSVYFGNDTSFDERKGADMQDGVPSWINPSVSINMHRAETFEDVVVLDTFAQKLIFHVLCDFDVRCALKKAHDLTNACPPRHAYAFNQVPLL